jgi:hypothetical protein
MVELKMGKTEKMKNFKKILEFKLFFLDWCAIILSYGYTVLKKPSSSRGGYGKLWVSRRSPDYQ